MGSYSRDRQRNGKGLFLCFIEKVGVRQLMVEETLYKLKPRGNTRYTIKHRVTVIYLERILLKLELL